MTKTLLFGGSGFFGPVILSKDPNIISVGRTKPPSYCQNKHIQINHLDELNKLDSIEFDKVIFLIGSSNHHDININIDMGIDFNVYPLNKSEMELDDLVIDIPSTVKAASTPSAV